MSESIHSLLHTPRTKKRIEEEERGELENQIANKKREIEELQLKQIKKDLLNKQSTPLSREDADEMDRLNEELEKLQTEGLPKPKSEVE